MTVGIRQPGDAGYVGDRCAVQSLVHLFIRHLLGARFISAPVLDAQSSPWVRSGNRCLQTFSGSPNAVGQQSLVWGP